jgi:hypothetical protein
MPPQVCSRCRRTNPADAVFCHFDGIPLSNTGPGAVAGALPHEFAFSSGRRCRTYDELAQGCYQDWEDARELLRRGEFTRFLTRAGRADLARAAQEAQSQGDPDIALFNFVRALPANPAQQPRLDISPRRMALGTMKIGESKQAKLTVSNTGQGVLQGKVAVTEGGNWLKIADGDGTSCPVHSNWDQVVPLRVQTAGLVPQAYSGRLTVITNGGIAEVPVRLEVAAVPFAQGQLKGAASPRQMAEKMRKHPKAAAPLLINGEIARWFAANGWAYPVAGQPAPGVAAVQQFFECMGLSKPPPLQLSAQVLSFQAVRPQALYGQVTLRTPAKKWVYAQATSDRPWLRVTTPAAGGPQQAQFAFEVDSSAMEEDHVHEGTVQLIANAGQKLSVRVVVDVRRPREPVLRQLLRPFVVVTFLFLLFRLLAIPASDIVARVLPPANAAVRGTLQQWTTPATEEEAYLQVLVLATSWVGCIVGVIVVFQRQGRWADYICGFLAGYGTGVAASATLGCALSAGDVLPRFVLTRLAAAVSLPESRLLVTSLWWVVACFCWMLLGGLLGGLLTFLGPVGSRAVDWLGAPVAWLLRLCGLNRLASLFSP